MDLLSYSAKIEHNQTGRREGAARTCNSCGSTSAAVPGHDDYRSTELKELNTIKENRSRGGAVSTCSIDWSGTCASSAVYIAPGHDNVVADWGSAELWWTGKEAIN